MSVEKNLTRTDETETKGFLLDLYGDGDEDDDALADRIDTHDGAWIKEPGPAGEPVWRWWAAEE